MNCRLHIADICFYIRFKRSDFHDLAWNEAAYRPFLLDEVADVRDTIKIDIFGKSAKVPDDAKKIFDSDGPWVLYSNGNEYIFANVSPGRDEPPLWIANIRLREKKAEIFCNPATLNSMQRKYRYNPVSYPFDQFLAGLFLADNCGAIFHSAGWIADDVAWMFAGCSGAGKSTISEILAKKTGIRPISDDRVVVRKIENKFISYGTPWTGESIYATNRQAPLQGMFFLQKGEENRVVDLSFREAITKVLPVLAIPMFDRRKTERTLAFCQSLFEAIPMYGLTFKKEGSVLEVLRNVFRKSGDRGFP